MSTNADIKVAIRDLYKIFGPNAAAMTEHVGAGMSKDDLLERHGHVLGLKDINLDVEARHIQVVMGLSGSGKSTLIRHINRLIEPTGGEVLVDGVDVLAMSPPELRDFRRSKASMVFQRFALLPHRTVVDNVAYGLHIQGVDKAEVAERSQRWIDRVGLSGYEEYYTAQLSGGMQQRVNIAAALVHNPAILLLDEPFGALDELTRESMGEWLGGVLNRSSKTVIFVTHSVEEATILSDRVVVLSARPGRIAEVIEIGLPRPRSKAFRTDENFLREVARVRSSLYQAVETSA